MESTKPKAMLEEPQPEELKKQSSSTTKQPPKSLADILDSMKITETQPPATLSKEESKGEPKGGD
jgi:hypothetical protein